MGGKALDPASGSSPVDGTFVTTSLPGINKFKIIRKNSEKSNFGVLLTTTQLCSLLRAWSRAAPPCMHGGTNACHWPPTVVLFYSQSLQYVKWDIDEWQFKEIMSSSHVFTNSEFSKNFYKTLFYRAGNYRLLL